MHQHRIDSMDNLKRLKELTDTVVPYGETVTPQNPELFQWDQGGGQIKTLYAENHCTVAVAEVQKDSVHRFHNHKEREILSILEGECTIVLDSGEVHLGQYDSFNIDPGTGHTVLYPIDTRVLVITMPASKDLPDASTE